jgi:NTP pyrophosphatase (non-canonical NTP hydrolase)
MTFEEFMKTTPRTIKLLGDNEKDIQHSLYGMITELAEVIDLYKKNLAYGKNFSIEQLEDETGDLFYYLSSFLHAAKLDPSRVMQKNFEKLLVRFPEGFEANKAINPNKAAEFNVFSKY